MKFLQIASFGLVLCLTGCEAMVYKQAVPITTNPMGAEVFIDGTPAGITPTSVQIARNSDHIVTLTKDGYKQEDVSVKRVYDAESTLLSAIGKGVSAGDFFGNTSMGIESGISSMSSQKQTGEAYTLSPATISVRLLPKAGMINSSSSVNEQGSNVDMSQETSEPGNTGDIISLMTHFDREMLDRALETGNNNQVMKWTSPQTGYYFQVSPTTSQRSNGRLTRDIKIMAMKDGKKHYATYPTYRENRNDWRIGYPMDNVSGHPDVKPLDIKALAFGAAEIGASQLQPITKSHTDSSTNVSHSFGADGSETTTTNTNSTKVSASVNPAGIVDLLEDLTK
ncbi:MAG: PEGA domain-containing protein [Desulfotalea sp.]